MTPFLARVIEVAGAGLGEEETGLFTQYVEQVIPLALQELTDKIVNDPVRRRLLNQTVKITLISGVGDLSSAVNATTGSAVKILQTGLIPERVFNETNEDLEYLPYLWDLNRPHSEDFGYYALDNGQIYTRGKFGQVEGSSNGGSPVVDMTGQTPNDPPATPDVTGYSGDIRMVVPVDPTVDTLHPSLTEDAVMIVVEKLQKNRLAMQSGQPGTQAGKGQV